MSIIENFSLDKIENLSQNDAKEYLTKYFIPLTDGNHAFYHNGEFEILETKVVKSTYFNRMSKELNEYYFKRFKSLKTITYQINKEPIIGDKLNLCPKMKAQKVKPYKEYDDKTKKGVEAMKQYIKEVLADNSQESYEYLIKWIANMLKGNKNDACLYLKGEQGIGKSTLFDFLIDYVIGEKLSYQEGSQPLRSEFNIILAGKLLVVFEELENMSMNEWNFISSKLKRYITQDKYSIRNLFMKPYTASNMNNYIINSNNDAIKDDDGRRYFILDVSHKYRENHDYFGKLRKETFNDLVGEAFYAYMLEVDTNGFIPQHYPITKSKLNSYVKRLNKVYEFIKEEFILQTNSLNHTTKELYDMYSQFCNLNNYKKLDKTEFHLKLSQVNISYKKTNGNTCYKYTVEALTEIATKFKWLHELDNVVDDKNETECDDEPDYKKMVEQKNIEIQNLLNMIDQQRKEIEDLKKQEPDVDLFATL
jgi:hypothetical protein